jgi:DNA polymerase III alpha subunit
VKGKGGAVFHEEENRFVFEKASAAGLAAETAAEIWRQVSKFASYSYCKAHASVYGRLAWLTARLKAHYPREFYAAILNCHKSMYPKRVFAWDAMRHGIPVSPPDVTRSDVGWRPTASGLLAGLGGIRGVRSGTVLRIVGERRRRPFADILDLRRRVPFHKGELERLVLLDSCRAFGRREDLLAELDAVGGDPRQMLLFTSPGGSAATRLPPLVKVEWSLTGIPLSLHPVGIVGREVCQAGQMPGCVNRRVSMFGILDAVKYTKTQPKGDAAARTMSFATLEDPSGLFEVVLFPDTHERLEGMFKSVGPYLVTGTVREQWDSVTLEVDDAVCF